MAGAMRSSTARHVRDIKRSDIKRSSAIRRLPQPPIMDPNPRPDEIFRFLDLPAELRNRIYSMLTVPEDPISLDYGYICRRAANLMAVNTQMRSEGKEHHHHVKLYSRKLTARATVANIYYGDNTFIFDVYASKIFMHHAIDPKHFRYLRKVVFTGYQERCHYKIGCHSSIGVDFSRIKYGVDSAVTMVLDPDCQACASRQPVVRTNVVKTIQSMDLDDDRLALTAAKLSWIMPLG
ncbi:hypothetical protein PRZ48_010009 [Zasmidium cellare]|uniref:F-box domain-containing protein n=1 Tax=Zasmidium cellare TaxID=395010 RepID=A0ABR0EDB6_ZASCE|nr:hypothetical protein PRZ48_010009 [Zasmidium cellare]